MLLEFTSKTAAHGTIVKAFSMYSESQCIKITNWLGLSHDIFRCLELFWIWCALCIFLYLIDFILFTTSSSFWIWQFYCFHLMSSTLYRFGRLAEVTWVNSISWLVLQEAKLWAFLAFTCSYYALQIRYRSRIWQMLSAGVHNICSLLHM